MELAPIVLFTYNRPIHTKKTIEKLLMAELASESDLIVFSDGPKYEKDIEKVEETRKVLDEVKGFKSIKVYRSEKNKGLAKSVINGVNSVIEQYGTIIVLEDDILVSAQFLRYMNHYLDFYKEKNRVISIHAFVYPLKNNSANTYFIRGADCQAWGTWKRGWDLFENDADKLYKEISSSKEKSYQFDFEGSYPYLKMLKSQIDGKVDSWAIRWYASAFLKDKLTLYPSESLVQNIGMDGSGTHSENSNVYEHIRINEKIENLLIAPHSIEENREMFIEFKKFFKSMKPSIFKRFINKIK